MAPYPGKYVLSILKKSVIIENIYLNIVANLDGKCQTHPTQIRSPWQKGQLKNTDYTKQNQVLLQWGIIILEGEF